MMKPAGVVGPVLGILGLIMSLNAADAAAAGKKVAYFDSGPTHPYIAAMNRSFNARAKDLGMVVTQFDTPYDAALQARQIDDAIARKFDALAIQSASQSAVIPPLNRAKNAGIPVILINNPMKPGLEQLYVTEIADDNPKLGRLAAQSIVKALKEGGRSGARIALITGVLAEGVAKDRLEAFNEVNEARQDRERTINQAQEQANREIPKARGEAARAVTEAEGYALERVNRARGEADRFVSVLAEYRRAPDVTRKRLYLEALKTMLPAAKTLYVVDADQEAMVPWLSLDSAPKPAPGEKP